MFVYLTHCHRTFRAMCAPIAYICLALRSRAPSSSFRAFIRAPSRDARMPFPVSPIPALALARVRTHACASSLWLCRSFDNARALANSLFIHSRAMNANANARELAPKRLGIAYVQILGVNSDTKDISTPTIVIATDKSRYAFNIAEGFQRFCVERRWKLTRTNAILLTRVRASSAGGVVGMFLTMSDTELATRGGNQSSSGVEHQTRARRVDVHAPRKRLRALAKATQSLFGQNRAVAIGESGFDRASCASVMKSEAIVRDGEVTITPVVVGGAKVLEGEGEYDSFSDDDARVKRARVEARKESWDDELEEVASYDVRLAGIPGKFDMESAMKLGVPNGPQRGALVRGESITLQNGTVITPDMCVAPEQPGPRVIVFDVPSEAHVAEALAAGEPLFGDVADVNVVVHIASSTIVSSDAYALLVAKTFGGASKASHVFANSKAMDEAPVFASSQRIQARLHALHDDIFPDPRDPSSPPPSPSKRSTSKYVDKIPMNIPNAVAGKNMFKFVLTPLKMAGADASAVPQFIPAHVHRRQVDKRTIALASKAIAHASPPRVASTELELDMPVPKYLSQMRPGDVELVFLGTGSAMPAKYRNVSGFFMQFDGQGYRGNIMLDTGEGSLAQMIRRYGATKVDAQLKELKLVWISHIHADHHVGLPGILTARQEAFAREGLEAPTIPVVGPRPLRRFLDSYEQLEYLGADFIDLADTTRDKWASETMSPEIARVRAALAGSDLDQIIAVPVNHCSHAYGAKLVGKRGWSMVYSGDTRPCQSLIDAARDVTLLVHEATFENDMWEEAIKKRHSTTKEAAETGNAARAYRTILTHFSQRYPKVPVFDGSHTARITVAFDLMSVDFANLTMLPRLLPAVRSLFRDDDVLANEAAEDVDDDAA